TLATAHYRNGAWRESLETLETVKRKAGELDAVGWLLVAMNRHQQKQREPARAALRKAVKWIGEQQQKAEDNPLLRMQLDMLRPRIESLRREAEHLIEGKGGARDGVG